MLFKVLRIVHILFSGKEYETHLIPHLFVMFRIMTFMMDGRGIETEMSNGLCSARIPEYVDLHSIPGVDIDRCTLAAE